MINEELIRYPRKMCLCFDQRAVQPHYHKGTSQGVKDGRFSLPAGLFVTLLYP